MNIKLNYILFTLQLVCIFFVASLGYCYEVNVHEKIADKAITSSSLNVSLVQAGFNSGIEEIVNGKAVWRWLEEGSKKEDEHVSQAVVTRYINHFYDPLTGLGLVDPPFVGTSSYLWASKDGFNAWRWEMARTYFYDGLTKNTKTEREDALSKAFRAIGQVMHLVQDLAVPAHVRNDAHPEKDLYERWTSINVANLNYASAAQPLSNVSVSASAPKQLWDTEKYDGTNPPAHNDTSVGLAEYTNANFYSKDTIGKEAVYPHPRRDNTNYVSDFGLFPISVITTNPGNVSHNTFYIEGYGKKHLAALKYFGKEILELSGTDVLMQYKLSLFLDNRVHEEYAKFLVPRAVGYSAGLLNYFFRGDIEISPPDNVLYAVTGPGGDFRQVRLKAKNNTANGEAMDNGQIHLVIKYKLAQSDPFQSTPVTVSDEFSYIIVPEKNARTDIPAGEPVELIFDLADSGTRPAGAVVPLWATDVYLQVVYKGQLGNELDAVAVGFKDISEPTPVDLVNHMDLQCLNGSIYAAGSQEALEIVDTNHNGIADEWDIYPHGMTGNEVWFSPVPAPEAATVRERDLTFPGIPSGQYGRTYILTEPNETTVSMNVRFNLHQEDSRDTCQRDPRTRTTTLRGVKNQTDYIDGEYITTYPILSLIRGVKVWSGIAVQHVSYPDSGTCSIYNTAQPALAGPIASQTP